MHKKFKVNQHVLVKNSAEKILILKFHEGDIWMFPGGRMEEADNTLEEGLNREIQEETGLADVQIGEMFHIALSPSSETVLLTYKATVGNEPAITLSDEHIDFAWVDKDTIDDYVFSHESDKQKILTYLSGEKF